MPKTCTDIQTFNARNERLNCRPRSDIFGWSAPHIRILQDVVLDSERLLERGRILYQQAPHLVRLKEPLVCVKTDRIGAFNTAQEFFFPYRSRQQSRRTRHLRAARFLPPRSNPPSPPADRWLPCWRPPALAHTAMGTEPGGAVVSHGAGKRVHVQAELPVDRKSCVFLPAGYPQSWLRGYARCGSGRSCIRSPVPGGRRSHGPRQKRRHWPRNHRSSKVRPHSQDSQASVGTSL